MKPTYLLAAGLLIPLWASNAQASALLKPTSGVTEALAAKSLDIDTRIQGSFAQTTLTTIYANPNNDQIEADFIYSAPQGSVVTGFSYWYRGEKVVARVVEKKRAAQIYQYITSRMRDPALIEMVGKNTFRARIFPVEARTDLKIEIKLAQTLPSTKAGALWSYALQDEMSGAPALQNVHLSARVVGANQSATSNIGAFKNGVLRWQGSNFRTNTPWRLLVNQPDVPLRATLSGAKDGGSDGFFALSLSSKQAITTPKPQISGVSTYEVFYPTKPLKAGEALFVFGRYKGGGVATVSLSGQSASITFPQGRETGNVAAQLWGTEKISRLSGTEKNRSTVMALSKRFGVPSKWTSWLAIPSEERKTFKKQMLASDRESAARAYAKAVANGKGTEAQKQKRIVADLTSQLKQIGYDYSSNEELQPLRNYLNEELKSVSGQLLGAKYGALSRTQKAALTRQQRNLRSAGARANGAGVEMPVYMLEDELRIASREWIKEVEAGRKNSRRAKAMQARLDHLGGTRVAKEYGWDENTFISEQAEMRANDLAMQIAVNTASDKPDKNKERLLKASLNRLAEVGSIDVELTLSQATSTIWQQKMDGVAARLADEISLRRENGPLAKKLYAQLASLEKKAGSTSSTHEFLTKAWQSRGDSVARHLVFDADFLSSNQKQGLQEELQIAAKNLGSKPEDLMKPIQSENIRDQYNATTDKLVDEILGGREDSTVAKALQEKVTSLQAQSSDWWQPQAVTDAYRGRAHELAFQIARENLKPTPDTSKINALESDLKEVATKINRKPEEFRVVEDVNAAQAKSDKFNIEPYRYRVVGLNPSSFQGGYGGGDPLLTIEAPADAQQVIAILPDGTTKQLEYRPERKRWEANFDIPTGTLDGDYFVQFIIIEKDGTRHTLKMRYRVDAQAPQGTIKMATGANANPAEATSINLCIGTGDDVTRVTAFLPWGDRLDLRRDKSKHEFVAVVPVPSNFAAQAGVVRFVLLDNAHNRTEMSMDWTK